MTNGGAFVACGLGLVFSALPAISQGLDFTPTELPWAAVDNDYAPPPLVVKGETSCYAGPAAFTAAGDLPEGIALNSIGQFTGVPRKTGTYHFQIRVANQCSARVREATLFVTGAAILVVSSSTLEFRSAGGAPPPGARAFLVRGTWPDLAYSVDSHEVAWLRATPARGRVPRVGAGVDADRVMITVVPGSLVPGVYEGKLTFGARQVANVVNVRVRLTVE